MQGGWAVYKCFVLVFWSCGRLSQGTRLKCESGLFLYSAINMRATCMDSKASAWIFVVVRGFDFSFK